MYSFIKFIGNIISRIVDILNIHFFNDIPLSLLDIILGALLIKVILTFVSGGYKEIDRNFDFSRIGKGKVSSKMSNKERENQLMGKNGVWYDGKTGKVVK